MPQLTPMMRQYVALKEKYNDCLLLYRLGDFYELFFDDALTASKELEITLTGRDCGLSERAPMCGVPYHAVQGYIDKLIKKGYKVAICEQTSDPAASKGLVDREVIRVITPGTVTETTMLSDTDNNYIMAVCVQDQTVGVAYADVSTGAFHVGECEADGNGVVSELTRVLPSEIIHRSEDAGLIASLQPIITQQNIFVGEYPSFTFEADAARDSLLSHFKVKSLAGYGLQSQSAGVCAAGALIDYLRETQKNALAHINRIRVNDSGDFMSLDVFTRSNLELTKTLREGRVRGSLFGTIDRTKTAMGARLLKRYINEPLQSIPDINARLSAVEQITASRRQMDEIAEALSGVFDLERLISRISYGSLDARNCLSLKASLLRLPALKQAASGFSAPLLRQYAESLDTLQDIHALLEASIEENPPAGIMDGGIIRSGYREDIDELKNAAREGKGWLASLERTEREITGIKNLKVGFNKVFGYYIEVTKSNLTQVPYRYTRKQTLVGSERFITPELKEMEEKILGAEDKCIALEYECFVEIRGKLADAVSRFQTTANTVAALDVLRSFAAVAFEKGYTRPKIIHNDSLNITGGRHPVVESFVGQSFVKNDTQITDDGRIMILTGPNMAGKSTYMRQVALIVLMAHMGSFVPADSADICLVDKIFTRVGASDNLASGQSTFMVEMNEVANILNNATPRSLLILDEIGRGTSTLDGLSIAWSVVEYISSHFGAKTLFATHFHELSELEGIVPGVRNYSITVKEMADTVIFLHKIVRGGADKSFGIEVAKLAGVPHEVTGRAKQIMRSLIEKDESILGVHPSIAPEPEFGQDDISEMLRSVNLDNITPLEALALLSEIKHKLKVKPQ